MLTLKELLFKKILELNLEHIIKDYYYLHIPYLEWKNFNYTYCSYCNNFIKKEFSCEICSKYYYCLDCWDNNTYYCFLCNKTHCFVCNSKFRSCYICKFNRKYNNYLNN